MPLGIHTLFHMNKMYYIMSKTHTLNYNITSTSLKFCGNAGGSCCYLHIRNCHLYNAIEKEIYRTTRDFSSHLLFKLDASAHQSSYSSKEDSRLFRTFLRLPYPKRCKCAPKSTSEKREVLCSCSLIMISRNWT